MLLCTPRLFFLLQELKWLPEKGHVKECADLDSLEVPEALVLISQVGEEAAGRDIDDPWPAKSKRKQGSGGAKDLAEPLSTVVLDETLPIGAHDLWRLVMADPEFQSSVHKLNKHREAKFGRWHLTEGAFAETDHGLCCSLNSAPAPILRNPFNGESFINVKQKVSGQDEESVCSGC